MTTHTAALLCGTEAALNDYQTQMAAAIAAVADWLRADTLYTGGSVRQLQPQIDFCPTADGIGLPAALERAVSLFLHNSLNVHHRHSLAHLHCPTLIASQVAEVLINAANQSMDSWDQSPAASLMEIRLIDWLRQRLGYAAGDGGVFTSGGTQSNLMGLLLARDACVARHWQDETGAAWSVQQRGLPPDAATRLKFICSENAHFSVQKNLALLGLGFQAALCVPTDADGRIDINQLARTLADVAQQGQLAACVVATAGTTDAGAIDDIAAIRALTEQSHIWLHVDAAWGGALLFSPRHRHRLCGIDTADSVTLDFHKHFWHSISCGAFLLRRPEDFRQMHHVAEYLNSAYDELHQVPNLVAKSLQTTRRFDALKLWLAIEALGETAYGALIDHTLALAQTAAERLRQQAELELLLPPQLASVLFRVCPSACPPPLLDTLNQNVADELFARGQANIGVTRLHGRQALKLTLLNPNTGTADIDSLFAMVRAEAKRILPGLLDGSHRAAASR